VAKVLAQHLLLQQRRTVYRNASRLPFDNVVVVFGIPQHVRDLVKKLGGHLGIDHWKNSNRHATARYTITRDWNLSGDGTRKIMLPSSSDTYTWHWYLKLHLHLLVPH
jgi:hypothetical protein